MFALIAAICFAVALIIHLAVGHSGGLVFDFLAGGALAVALHLAFTISLPRRP